MPRVRRLVWLYLLCAASLVCLFAAAALMERLGVARATVGYTLFLLTILVYAGIGVRCRTNDAAEYFCAGRRIPAVFNGMATAADWMSAASFFGIAGAIYLQGYGGLAYIYGWTGGFVLVAVLVAPYLRRFGHCTLPDFFAARYGGNIARLTAVALTIHVSFLYLVAQIYGIGLVATRLTQVPFEIGVWIGLGGVLVCSFLGGMKAITWTQVAQYVVLILAYLVPVVWLSVQMTGQPIPTVALARQLAQISQAEQRMASDPAEIAVQRSYEERAARARARLVDPQLAYARDKLALQTELDAAQAANDALRTLRAEAALDAYPATLSAARELWEADAELARARTASARHSQPYDPGTPDDTDDAQSREQRDGKRRNFLATIICLMLGTAAMPHILVRSCTAESGRDARRAIAWALFFIALLYINAPVVAGLAKQLIQTELVGSSLTSLPSWVSTWQRIDPSLISVTDVNGDGIVQRAEIGLGTDIIVLATPDIAGLPFVVSALVAAGGLAASLSTADGLLLTIATCLSHDVYYRMVNPRAKSAQRVMVGKFLLLMVAAVASMVAAQRPGDLLFLVTTPFSFAAASFFPALVLGVFWKRTTAPGAVAGMIVGTLVTAAYISRTQPVWREWLFGIARGTPIEGMIGGIEPVAAGIFGIPAAFATMVVVSLLTPVPDVGTRGLVDRIRRPSRSDAKSIYNARFRRDG